MAKLSVLLAPLIAASGSAQAVPPVIVPPGSTSQPSGRSAMRTQIGDYRISAVNCDGVSPAVVHREAIIPFGRVEYRAPTIANDSVEFVVGFDIDNSGRPLNLHIADPPSQSDSYAASGDILPALSLWKFAPGQVAEGCEALVSLTLVEVKDSPPILLQRYIALARPNQPGGNRSVARDAFRRMRPAGATCQSSPTPRVTYYPPYDQIPIRPGGLDYSFLSYDIASGGAPADVTLVSSSGNERLDRESMQAVAASRFAPEGRLGCIQYYFRHATQAIPAPTAPHMGDDDTGACRVPDDKKWETLPKLIYPREFARRSIEGWAVVRYDVAPWGETGNVTVVEAQPAAAFGTEAARIVKMAKAKTRGHGRIGCVQFVKFEMADGPPPEPDEDADTQSIIVE